MSFPKQAFSLLEDTRLAPDPRIDSFVQNSERLYQFFWTIQHKIRLSLLKELSVSPRNVKELSKLVGELHSVTSFHLKLLRRNNLVDYKIDGKKRIYFLTNILFDLSDPISECQHILLREQSNES